MSKGFVRNNGANEWKGSDIPSFILQGLSTYSLPEFEQTIRTSVQSYGYTPETQNLQMLKAILSYAEGIGGLGSDQKKIVDDAFNVLRHLEFEQRQQFIQTVHQEEDAMFGGGVYEDTAMISNAEDRLFPNENLKFQADPNHASIAAMFSNEQQNFFDGPYSQASLYGNYRNGSMGSMDGDYTDVVYDGQDGMSYGQGDYQDVAYADQQNGMAPPQPQAGSGGYPQNGGAPRQQHSNWAGLGNLAAGLGKGIGQVISATQSAGQPAPGTPGSPFPPSQFVPPGATPQNYWPQQAANARTAAVNTQGMTPEYRREVMVNQGQAGTQTPTATATATTPVAVAPKTPAPAQTSYTPYVLGGVAILALGFGFWMYQSREEAA